MIRSGITIRTRNMKEIQKNLTIIGGGNLGLAIAKGVLAAGLFQAGRITVTRRRTELLGDLAAQGVNVTASNIQAVAQADMVLLAIKPYQVEQVCAEIAPHLKGDCLVISVATGVSAEKIHQWLPGDRPLFRAMPNTAVEIGESMTCISSLMASPEQEAEVLAIFNKVGVAVMIPEELMGAATALGACGIAFALRFVRAGTQAGIEIGFNSKLASQIVAQTVKGAAELIIRHNSHPEEEIDKVTTPRGVTISGLNEMEHRGFSSSLIKGVITSYRKIEGIQS